MLALQKVKNKACGQQFCDRNFMIIVCRELCFCMYYRYHCGSLLGGQRYYDLNTTITYRDKHTQQPIILQLFVTNRKITSRNVVTVCECVSSELHKHNLCLYVNIKTSHTGIYLAISV